MSNTNTNPNPDKPFKSIEVIDARTNESCKIACMPCIRGHRTISCGIPVCRTKNLWTVKRPGRPSNSCTCMYGSTGGCKCVVVAKTACPHKPKKGEKRSEECRCDEHGRFCCYLEPKHWDQLMALQKPTVDFFRTKEELEAAHAAQKRATMRTTPSWSANSPGAFSVGSSASTPAPPSTGRSLHFVPSEYNMRSPSQSITPRFGMMGLGAPQGSEYHATPDVLAWNGQVPQAPLDYHPSQYDADLGLPEGKSCCQRGPTSPPPSASPSQQQPPHTPGLPHQPTFPSFTTPHLPILSFPDQQHLPSTPQPSNYERFATAYFNHQFPSAICQTCGLAGCTCRMCPPVLQNVANGSWAQCCGRKHARTTTYVAPDAVATFAEQPPLLQQQREYGFSSNSNQQQQQPPQMTQQSYSAHQNFEQQQEPQPMTQYPYPTHPFTYTSPINPPTLHYQQPQPPSPQPWPPSHDFLPPHQHTNNNNNNNNNNTNNSMNDITNALPPDFPRFDYPNDTFTLPEGVGGSLDSSLHSVLDPGLDLDLSEFLMRDLEQRPPEEEEGEGLWRGEGGGVAGREEEEKGGEGRGETSGEESGGEGAGGCCCSSGGRGGR
ncbi:hypothetical protein B0A50_08231 [Salinomyces thailandicus]|uniref:Copper-fist domain-containing protein n=1 Tax=Salinomyces thailandicus TaxID=706561 RepID=A0A4V6WJM2_9PEZI|nr:hypothetical protein B0A50_08231 [Salinomyces thailandica]